MLIHDNVRNFKCDLCPMAFCTRQTLRTHTRMQHNVILPTESKKGKKLGPRKNKGLKKAQNGEDQMVVGSNPALPVTLPPPVVRRPEPVMNPVNPLPLNLVATSNSHDGQSVASEDSWVPQGYFTGVYFIIQFIKHASKNFEWGTSSSQIALLSKLSLQKPKCLA